MEQIECVESGPQMSELSSEFLQLRVENGLRLSFWNDFVAGCLAGSAGILTGYPLDTIKVRQQTNGLMGYHLRKVTVETITRDPRGLFRGLTFPVVSEGFRNSLFFGVYGKILGKEQITSTHPSLIEIASAAGIAGGIQGLAATPIELVKIQLQAQNGIKKPFRGSVDCVYQLYKLGGIRALFHGTTITMIREVPALATYMTTFTFLRRQGLRSADQQHPSLGIELVAGGLAGVMSWSVTMPIDVVKSRIQSDHIPSPKYQRWTECFVNSWKKEGWRVFWRGLSVTCLRAFPVNAVTLVTYTKSLTWLNENSQQLDREE